MAASTTRAYSEPRAHELRDRYSALFEGPGFPVPVDSIAEDLLGLHVIETELDGVSGLLVPANREMYINVGDTPARRRFTLAHEIGHWVCQCLEGRGQPLMCRSEDVGTDTDRALEREANVFAAELLMPESSVREKWSGDVAATARAFGVSTQAMQWRLYSFGLTEPPA